MIRVTHSRGPNAIMANPERMESEDGSRWATGRNVKRSLGNHRFDSVQVWTLKRRDIKGLAATVDSNCSRDDAVTWCIEGRVTRG